MCARNESEVRQTRKKERAGGGLGVESTQKPALGNHHAFAVFNSIFTDDFNSEVA
jgi:hypothetical protein